MNSTINPSVFKCACSQCQLLFEKTKIAIVTNNSESYNMCESCALKHITKYKENNNTNEFNNRLKLLEETKDKMHRIAYNLESLKIYNSTKQMLENLCTRDEIQPLYNIALKIQNEIDRKIY